MKKKSVDVKLNLGWACDIKQKFRFFSLCRDLYTFIQG